jgi:hypothetical protein
MENTVDVVGNLQSKRCKICSNNDFLNYFAMIWKITIAFNIPVR